MSLKAIVIAVAVMASGAAFAGDVTVDTNGYSHNGINMTDNAPTQPSGDFSHARKVNTNDMGSSSVDGSDGVPFHNM